MPWFRMDVHWYQDPAIEELGERFGHLALSTMVVLVSVARERGPLGTVKATPSALASILRVAPETITEIVEHGIELGLLRELRDHSTHSTVHVEVRFSSESRRAIPLSQRERILAKGNGLCGICGSPIRPYDEVHIDHIVPVARGGSDDDSNLQPAHGSCNRSKGAR